MPDTPDPSTSSHVASGDHSISESSKALLAKSRASRRAMDVVGQVLVGVLIVGSIGAVVWMNYGKEIAGARTEAQRKAKLEELARGESAIVAEVKALVERKVWDGAIDKGGPYEPVASDALKSLLAEARRGKFAKDRTSILADVKHMLDKKDWDGALTLGEPYEAVNDESLTLLLADARQGKVNLNWAKRDRESRPAGGSGSTRPQVGMTEEEIIPLCGNSYQRRAGSYAMTAVCKIGFGSGYYIIYDQPPGLGRRSVAVDLCALERNKGMCD